MPEYSVEIPMRITVEASTALEAHKIALSRADALTSDASYVSIPHHERGYAPSRVRQSMRSRQTQLHPPEQEAGANHHAGPAGNGGCGR